MRMHLRYVPVAVAVLAFSVPARAQQADAHLWGRGTTLTAFAGATLDTEPLAGGSIGWKLTPRLALEGSGLWVDDDAGNAFAGSLTLQANLLPGHRTVPYVQAGLGLYRTSIDRGNASIPPFYRRRMDTGATTARTFTDPSLVIGAGVNLFVSRNVALRPDAQIMMVMRDARSHFVTALRMSVVYHIEDHPVTPARRR